MQMKLTDIIVDVSRTEELKNGYLYLLTRATPFKNWPKAFQYKGGIYNFEAIDIVPQNLLGMYHGYARYKKVN